MGSRPPLIVLLRISVLFFIFEYMSTLSLAQNNSAQFCESLGGPEDGLLITSDCIDPTYSSPIIDSRSNKTVPGPHLEVSGHFDNTSIRFKFYYPPRDAWDGRFFQLAYPTQTEVATNLTIGFGLDSHAYTVQVTGTLGYRAEAAAAKFSKTVAKEYYGTEERIFGYIYGGSGGSLQAIGAAEQTVGVWDGTVPFVQAIPISIGTSQSMRTMEGLVLRNKSSEIQEVLKPGGSGDPYPVLNEVQKEILREVVLLGLPIEALEDFDDAVSGRMLTQIREALLALDPLYVDDFWTKEGYLGTEMSPLGDLFRDAVVEFNATVTYIERNAEGLPTSVLLKGTPAVNPLDYDGMGYKFTIFSPDGTAMSQLSGRYNQSTALAAFDVVEAESNDRTLYSLLSENTTLHVSTREWIALHAWYRYQVPEFASDRNYIGYDHLQTDSGSSIYPTRPPNVAQILSKQTTGGAEHSGKIGSMKMIVLQNLLDVDTLPWWAHWYAEQVRASLGESEFQDAYRLWYNDNADHYVGTPEGDRQMFVVNYEGICQQALRDLSAWVERGVAPPGSSKYSITPENAIRLPENAAERQGIQPTIQLQVANIASSGAFDAGDEVVFEAVVEAPRGAGPVVAVEWDFYGTGEFAQGEMGQPSEAVRVQARHAYQEPGEYVAGLRATVQREGDAGTAYARVMNLARVSVRVHG